MRGGKMKEKKLKENEEKLLELEFERKKLFKKLSKIGDMRRGTVYANFRKCGQKNCKCSKPGHPGHGPRYLWTTTIKGKSYSKDLALGSELQKYKTETDNHKKYLEISEKIIEVNTKICDLRFPVELEDNQEGALKKKLQRYYQRKLKEK